MTFLFHFSAMIVLPFWLAMIVVPSAKLTSRLVGSPWIILPPVVCYLAFVAPPLIVTLFFGPIGFGLYGLVRAGQALIHRRAVV
jgi:hypothetical protein